MRGVRSESIDSRQVFVEENWKCYLCDRQCIEWPGFAVSEAATLDHVMPVSKGGTHTRDNVRCCCWACNMEKSDMVLT